jgi:Rieske Fe-S protein
MSERAFCPGLCGGAESIGRRAFLSESVLAAAALALAACAGDLSGPPATVSSAIKVSDYPALAVVNGIATATLSGARLAIVRTGATSFVALSRVCPHQGGAINVSGSGFLCSKHGARFSATGAWVGGERTSNMRSYPVTYDAPTDTLTIG